MAEILSTTYLEAEIKSEVRRVALSVEKPCRIGRAPGNTIVLEDDLASRNHIIVQTSDSEVYYLTDLGSTNGTLVNGVRVTVPVVLRPGDVIQIGSHSFRFHQEHYKAPEPEVVEAKATSLFVAMRVISVLVVDIRDFTGLSQRIGPKIGEVAGTLFREGGQALQQHKAWAQKYIGDAVMAVWLHPGVQPRPEEFVPVFGSLLALETIAAGLQSRYQLDAPIRIGAGVNTGPASIGNFGSVATSDYTALGDVVNKAFRLESATKEVGFDIVVGPETHSAMARQLDISRVFHSMEVKLKGYDAPAKVFGANLASLGPLVEALRGAGQGTTKAL
ncbi:MAG: adenylate/guanylate cyclase domain-containing protein [Acidobacteria bacterium]|nr:adenylate/guanylate cyclase domain-containing protein [Acidobacteriota bacterium]